MPSSGRLGTLQQGADSNTDVPRLPGEATSNKMAVPSLDVHLAPLPDAEPPAPVQDLTRQVVRGMRVAPGARCAAEHGLRFSLKVGGGLCTQQLFTMSRLFE